jgi:hypothetical protein
VVVVSPCFEPGDDRRQVLCRRNLKVQLPAQGQHWTPDAAQGGRWVVAQEIAKPWRREERHLALDLGHELGGVGSGSRDDCRLKGLDQLADLRLRGLVVGLAVDHRIHRPAEAGQFGSQGARHPGGLVDPVGLGEKDQFASDSGCGEHHDPSDIRGLRSQHWSDDRALAVADQPGPARIDLRSRAQEVEARAGVSRVVGGGCRAAIAGGFTHAAVVEAQHREPKASQVVGKDKKGAMPKHGLVPVVRTRSGDQQCCGMRTRRPWFRERAGECHRVGRRVDADLLLVVREGSDGLLGPTASQRGCGTIRM